MGSTDRSMDTDVNRWATWNADYSIQLLIGLCGHSDWKVAFKCTEDLHGLECVCYMTWAGKTFSGQSRSRSEAEAFAALSVVLYADYEFDQELMLKASGPIFELACSKFGAPYKSGVQEDVARMVNGFAYRYDDKNGTSVHGPAGNNKKHAKKLLLSKLLAPLWANLKEIRLEPNNFGARTPMNTSGIGMDTDDMFESPMEVIQTRDLKTTERVAALPLHLHGIPSNE